MCSIRCVSKCLSRDLPALSSISCCGLYLLGQNPTCRRRYGDYRHRENSTFTKDAEKDVTRAKPQGQRKSNSSNTANSDVILPKIVNRWQMMANGFTISKAFMIFLCWSLNQRVFYYPTFTQTCIFQIFLYIYRCCILTQAISQKIIINIILDIVLSLINNGKTSWLYCTSVVCQCKR